MARMEIDRAREHPPVDAPTLYSLASAHYLRGELDDAIALLESAARSPGPFQGKTLDALELMRLTRSGKIQTSPFSAAKTGSKPVLDFPSGRPLGPDEWPEP
jgi:hypothetical protein